VRIVVRIDRVVLDGLPVERRDRATLEAALRAELAERFLSGRGPRADLSVRVNRVAAAPVTVSAAGTVAGLGSAIGGSVHGAIERGQQL
jgi:hypothetical protein